MRTKNKTATTQLKAQLLEVVEEEVTYTCPVRGTVKQLVKVQKFAPVQVEKVVVLKEKSLISSIEDEEVQRVLFSEEEF